MDLSIERVERSGLEFDENLARAWLGNFSASDGKSRLLGWDDECELLVRHIRN